MFVIHDHIINVLYALIKQGLFMGFKSRSTDMCTVPLWSYNLGLIFTLIHLWLDTIKCVQTLSHNHISIGEIQMED